MGSGGPSAFGLGMTNQGGHKGARFEMTRGFTEIAAPEKIVEIVLSPRPFRAPAQLIGMKGRGRQFGGADPFGKEIV